MAGEDVFSPKLTYQAINRRQLSQSLEGELTLAILNSRGEPIDPDEGSLKVTVSFTNPSDNTEESLVEGSDNWIRDGKGLYRFVLYPDKTQNRGLIDAEWDYSLDGHSASFTDHYQIIEYMPTYVSLTLEQRAIVERIAWRFADLFDNSTGGQPAFFEEFQTSYSYERIAQMMEIATYKINTTKQPLTNFKVGSLGSGRSFPKAWLGLLEMGSYLEVLRHFIRSYVEQPSLVGGSVTAVDRRDYMQRWQSVLQEESVHYDQQLILFKRKNMNLGRGALTVAGGVFGGGSSVFRPGGYAAGLRGSRFYTSAIAFNYGGSK